MSYGKIGRGVETALFVLLLAGQASQLEALPQAPQVESQKQPESAAESQHEAEKNEQATPKSLVVIPSAPTSNKREESSTQPHESTEEGSEYWPTFFGLHIKITDSLLALFTFLLFVYTARLYYATRGLWQVAKDQAIDMKASIAVATQSANAATLSAQAAIGIELPILKATPVNYLLHLNAPIPTNETFAGRPHNDVPSKYSGIGSVCIVNHGRTQAFPIVFEYGWKVASVLPPIPMYTGTERFNHAVVIKQDHDYTIGLDCTIELSESEIAVIGKETDWLWFYGSIHYFDFLNEKREARFCWRWANRNPIGEYVGYGFASDGQPPDSYIRAPQNNTYSDKN